MRTCKRTFAISNYWLITILFVSLKLTLHFLTNMRYELLRDEMLFFNMGEHLSAGYATVPPVTGILAFLINKIFGFSVFGIRLLPALMGAACIYIISVIVRGLGGGITAMVIAVSGYMLAPGFLLVGTLFTPNSFEELLWLLITWSVFRMVKTGNTRYWLLTGVLTGLSFLNKYSVVFLAVGIFIGLIFSNKRKLIFSKYFLLAVLAGLIIITPNIVWQYQHGWPVKIHMSELKSSQLDLMSYSGFLVSFYSFCQGTVLIWMTGLIALLFKSKENEYRYLGVASLAVLIMLFMLKGKGYYALAIIPFLLAFGGYVIEKYLTGSFLTVRYILVSISVLYSIAVLPSGLPLLSFENYSRYVGRTRHFICHPLHLWDNGTQHNFSQAYADMTGWKELAGYVAEAYNSLESAERKNCTIFCEKSYGYAGAVYFYGREYNLPAPVTFHESYVFWAPDSIPAGPVIYIYRDINDLDKLFGDIKEVGSVNNIYFRENGLKVFLCKSPVSNICEIYRQEAKEEKGRFSRKNGDF
jgi:hypothetical protein